MKLARHHVRNFAISTVKSCLCYQLVKEASLLACKAEMLGTRTLYVSLANWTAWPLDDGTMILWNIREKLNPWQKRHIPDGLNFQLYQCYNLKSYITGSYLCFTMLDTQNNWIKSTSLPHWFTGTWNSSENVQKWLYKAELKQCTRRGESVAYLVIDWQSAVGAWGKWGCSQPVGSLKGLK